MSLSLITLANLADAMACQANAAKVLAPFAPKTSAQHLKNARMLHKQIGELLAAADREQAQAIPSTSEQAA
jgi:hypothetical protein